MKVALSAKFRCLHRSHALCFRRSLENIQLFSTNYNVYMRELIAAVAGVIVQGTKQRVSPKNTLKTLFRLNIRTDYFYIS